MSIASEILQLPRNERLKCMEILWDSLRDEEVKSPEWHRTVLEDRVAKVESGKAEFISGRELKGRLGRD